MSDKKDTEMSMLSIPRKDHERLKKLAEKDGRSMRGAFKLMVDKYEKTVNDNNTGIGLLGLMFLIFMTLKLTDHIDWSWWWVTAPLWGPIALVIVIVIIAQVGKLRKR